MQTDTAARAAKLDKVFGTPACAVLLAILCNVLWGSAFPFIKMGYRLFEIQSSMNRTPAKQRMEAVLPESMENRR